MKKLYSLLNIILLSCIIGCMDAKFDSTADNSGIPPTGQPGNSQLNFAGISTISEVTDSSAKIHWNPHPEALVYDIYQIENSTPIPKLSVSPDKLSKTLFELNPETTYRFLVRIRTATGQTDLNTKTFTITTKDRPFLPATMTRIYPTNSSDIEDQPIIAVTGVKTADEIQIFSDDQCQNSVSSRVTSPSSSASIEITLNSLTPASYQLYSKVFGASGRESECSSSSNLYAAYEVLLPCPQNHGDFIPVPGDPDLGTSSFCVMKFEAKEPTAGQYRSQPSGVPAGDVNFSEAVSACQGLGGNYHLISNQDWMTIARNIERVPENWSSSIVGVGMINTGHSDGDPSTPQEVSDITNPYSNTNNNATQAPGSGWEQKRTHLLSNGEEIWDFAGNSEIRLNLNLTQSNQKPYSNAIGGNETNHPVELADIDRNVDELDPIPSLFLNPYTDGLSSHNGIGMFQAKANTALSLTRGGDRRISSEAGIYSISFLSQHTRNSAIGFRCVYHP